VLLLLLLLEKKKKKKKKKRKREKKLTLLTSHQDLTIYTSLIFFIEETWTYMGTETSFFYANQSTVSLFSSNKSKSSSEVGGSPDCSCHAV